MSARGGSVLTELRALRSEVAALGVQISRLAPPSKLDRRDLKRLEVLMPALVSAFGDQLFLSAEALRIPAVADVARQLSAKAPAKSLGKLFRRAQGEIIDGRFLTCVGVERGAALWRVSLLVSWFSAGVKPA